MGALCDDCCNYICLTSFVAAVYDRCIYKFDHYCAWTNNAVGGLNHRYFLLFLLSICVMCVEGVRLLMRCLIAISQVHQLHLLHYLDDNGHPQPINARVLIQVGQNGMIM